MDSEQRDGESASDRRAFNIFLLVFFLAVCGIGIWLVDAMIDARKADECLSTGRRNCAPIETPAR